MNAHVQVRQTGASDEALVTAVASGDLDALGTLFDRYEPTLRRFISRLGTPSGEVDDLVQATFLQLVSASARFDPSLSARSFLLGVAAMMTRRHRRSLGRIAARLRNWTRQPEPTGTKTPHQELEAHEADERLRRALASLPPKKRDVFVMVTLEGASGDDVARALGIPVNTVWTRLHHARKELRALLGESA
jgi:RNA polymerase sigma factor (sigma-70 family)